MFFKERYNFNIFYFLGSGQMWVLSLLKCLEPVCQMSVKIISTFKIILAEMAIRTVFVGCFIYWD